MSEAVDLSCEAKLARVVLDNRGPLSPVEVAEEARLSRTTAAAALDELVDVGLAEAACGLCESKETVYELVDATHAP